MVLEQPGAPARMPEDDAHLRMPATVSPPSLPLGRVFPFLLFFFFFNNIIFSSVIVDIAISYGSC